MSNDATSGLFPGVSEGTPGRPRLTAEEAVELTRSLYGVQGTASSLPSDRDQNFLIEVADGTRYLLKISNADEERSILEAQELILNVAREAGLSVPQIVGSTAGASIESFTSSKTGDHFVRLVTYLDGYPIAKARPQPSEILEEVGRFLGKLDHVLSGVDHEGAHRHTAWDVQNAPETIRAHIDQIVDPERARLVQHFLELVETAAMPILQSLPRQLIHGDANDYNVLVDIDASLETRLTGVVDFGDVMHTVRAAELAVACAYLMMDKDDPIAAACAVTSGYHGANRLEEAELQVLFPLICARLGMSVCMAAYQKHQEPDNEYLTISEQPAWRLLEQLGLIHPNLAWYRLRHACGFEPFPGGHELRSWLGDPAREFASVVTLDDSGTEPVVFDFSVGSTSWDTDDLINPGLASERLLTFLASGKTRTAIGRYDEVRLVYAGEQFATASGERRTVHIGLDVFQAAGSPVFAPFEGSIHSFRCNDLAGDYGPTIILRHAPPSGPTFYTLYGHLSRSSLDHLSVGMSFRAGDQIATIGNEQENGGWSAHLHFQIIGDMMDADGNFPGVAAPSQRDVWTSLCPDPNLICGIPVDIFPPPDTPGVDILRERRERIGPSLSISYGKPLHIVRGFMQHLYDANGQRFLDAVNNVPHVGHSHPYVVAAGRRQMGTLNTNTRYLHDHLVRYARRLTDTMPDPLSVVFFVNSGSEANDLALRIARAHTGARHTIVIDGAYHGNLSSLIDISPYKYDGSGGPGRPGTTHAVPVPDTYRGRHRLAREAALADLGVRYAQYVVDLAQELATGEDRAVFIAESALSCGGQIFFPAGYLVEAFEAVRSSGGICIADEVQVGMGRLGSHFWGFQTQNVVPDIVTIGKPIGNGHPLGAVVTTPEIAASFATGMEYFNTFGGNPVSCAIGMAVLDVIEQEELQANAERTGAHLRSLLMQLYEQHAIIGDVRGQGLFIGIEFVRDRESLEPAAEEARYIVNRMSEKGILVSTDGPLRNVIKIKPPLVFTEYNADLLAGTLNDILSEDPVKRYVLD